MKKKSDIGLLVSFYNLLSFISLTGICPGKKAMVSTVKGNFQNIRQCNKLSEKVFSYAEFLFKSFNI